MSPLIPFIVAAVMGVEVGWQPVDGGGFEYIIQLSPEQIDALKQGELVITDGGAGVNRQVRRYRLSVGRANLPRLGADPTNSQPIIRMTGPNVDSRVRNGLPAGEFDRQPAPNDPRNYNSTTPVSNSQPYPSNNSNQYPNQNPPYPPVNYNNNTQPVYNNQPNYNTPNTPNTPNYQQPPPPQPGYPAQPYTPVNSYPNNPTFGQNGYQNQNPNNAYAYGEDDAPPLPNPRTPAPKLTSSKREKSPPLPPLGDDLDPRYAGAYTGDRPLSSISNASVARGVGGNFNDPIPFGQGIQPPPEGTTPRASISRNTVGDGLTPVRPLASNSPAGFNSGPPQPGQVQTQALRPSTTFTTDMPMSADTGEKQWRALTTTLFFLFFSMGGNVWMGWMTITTQGRYKALVARGASRGRRARSEDDE